MGFSPSQALALLCADIHVSSVTEEGSRSVVRLGGFGLRGVREEEVCACAVWVLLTVSVVVLSCIKAKILHVAAGRQVILCCLVGFPSLSVCFKMATSLFIYLLGLGSCCIREVSAFPGLTPCSREMSCGLGISWA